jgi:hypothetical protein
LKSADEARGTIARLYSAKRVGEFNKDPSGRDKPFGCAVTKLHG